MKKIIILGIVILFVGMSFNSISGIQIDKKIINPSSRGNILYVGGCGPGNYSKIQDAVDNATEGDTVFVYEGVYKEHVYINKTINLIGENKENTVVDAGKKDDAIYIYHTSWVNISGFTLQNSGYDYWERDSGIDLNKCYFCKIFDNIFLDNNNGVILRKKSNKNIITDNYFFNNDFNIYIDYSSRNQIFNNILKGKNDNVGIYLVNTGHNNISCNTIYEHGKGITFITQCHNDKVYGNNIFSNVAVGIEIQSDFIDISYNTIENNHLGIYIREYYVESHRIFCNNFIKNNRDIIMKTDNCYFNNNYWGRFRFFPKIILGWRTFWIIYLPKLLFDYNPASKPFELPC
jgi:parallel beta-helix repeat protein